MKLSRNNFKTLVGKISLAQYEEYKKTKEGLIKRKEETQEVLEIRQTIMEIRELIQTLPKKYLDGSYNLNQFLTSSSCGEKTIAEIMFSDEISKINKCSDTTSDIEFRVSMLADTCITLEELIEKIENSFKINLNLPK